VIQTRLCLLVAVALVASQPAFAGDAFLKGSIMFHPRDAHISDRWLLSFGSDYPLNLSETGFLGFELRTALYQQNLGPSSLYVVPAQAFINGKFKAPTFGIRPYVGGGVGMVSFVNIFEGESSWNREAAVQFIGGVELGAATLELQAMRPMEDGADYAYFVLFGYIW
jgi:hypothetical protein